MLKDTAPSCAVCKGPVPLSRQKYCSRECMLIGQRQAGYQHVCMQCQSTYTSNGPIAGLCSNRCRRERAKERYRAKMARKEVSTPVQSVAPWGHEYKIPVGHGEYQRQADPVIGF